RVPAFDALDAGDLAIVPAGPLALIAPGTDELRALADALATARVAGVLLVGGEAGAERLEALAALLEASGVPGLRLGRTDPAALERAVIGFIVAHGSELERQAGLLASELQRRALDGGGPAALVAAIATFLGRAVALESARGDVLAVHAPVDAPEAAAAAIRYQARPRQSAALRFPLPVASGPAGALVLIGEAPASELARATVARIGGLLALELARDEAVRRAGDQARRTDALPSAGPPWIVLLARQRAPGLDDDTPGARGASEAIRREVRLLAPARRMALRGDADSLELRAVLALDGAAGVAGADAATRPDAEADPLALRIAALLARTVALSRPFRTRAERPAAEADARATLEAAVALAEPPAVARTDRLPVYRMLGGLHNLPEGAGLARALLEPILGGRPDVRRERLATLRAVLDHGGINEAAAALGVHRNTIAYRVRRIEAATGWQLSDPELRLPLAIAVRLVQEQQE
ncbi:MAG TPA: helix-turn-helix domain-containing protein, partial [Candidatus Limnocylindrales bacterium]|nr:helix-turn-helix domain-containing protein [Candidatus Limnocylindrales bacterium]